jgi:environmental stress-induced protein Ves
MRILRRADYRKMPWKNGKGVTEEVASFPEGAGLSDFGWRLSIAHVAEDGPFSVFPGIDRTITLLAGKGMILDLPDERVALEAGGAPFSFSGGLEISSRNIDGPTVDFNVMTRRGVYAHKVSRISAGEVIGGAFTFILVLDCEPTIAGAQILPLDIVRLEDGEKVVIKGEGRLLKIEIVPADR